MNLPKRKPNRLKKYDYSRNGAYFITVCVSCRDISLWDDLAIEERAIDNRPYGSGNDLPTDEQQKIPLSKYGIIVDEAICSIPSHYDNISVDKYIIMPNHIHIIILVTDVGERAIIHRPYGIVSTVVQQLKRQVTKQLGVSIWQRSFHDHVIRDENDYLVRWQYIDNNPAGWVNDEYYTR